MSELKKISAYVPKEIYKCLEKDKQEGEISLSQAIIAALANNYNIEVTVGKSGRRVTLGGETATAERVNALEQKFEQFSSNVSAQIEQILSAVQNNNRDGSRANLGATEVLSSQDIDCEQSAINNGTVKNQSIDGILDNSNTSTNQEKKNQQLALDTRISISPLTGKLLAMRLRINTNSVSAYKSRLSTKKFKDWSSKKDINNIPWMPNPGKKGYIPSEDTKEGQLIELQKWIAAHT